MSNQSQSQNKFGSNIWWTIPELAKDGKEVQAILKKHGFEENEIPLPSKRTEVSRAVKSFHNLQTSTNKCITVQPNEDDKEVVYGILDYEKKSTDEAAFEQTTTVRYSKVDDTVSVEGKLAEDVLFRVDVYKGKVTDDDVRSFLRHVITKCYGVAKRPTGGIYFIPGYYESIIKSAQTVLKDIDAGAKLYIEGVVNGEQERRNIWDSVEVEIEGQIEETLSAVECIGRRAEAVKNHEAKLDGLKELMDVYKGLLGEEAKYEGIAEKIEGAVKVTSEKIAKLQGGMKQPAKAPARAKPAVKAAAKPAVVKPAAQPAEQSAAGAAKPAAATKDNPWVKAAIEVLKQAGKPLHYREITEGVLKSGITTNGKTPEQTLRTKISLSIKNGDGYFSKVGDGIYAVAV